MLSGGELAKIQRRDVQRLADDLLAAGADRAVPIVAVLRDLLIEHKLVKPWRSSTPTSNGPTPHGASRGSTETQLPCSRRRKHAVRAGAGATGMIHAAGDGSAAAAL